MKRENLPDAVRKKLEALETETGRNLYVLSVHNDTYYVYSSGRVTIKETGRSKYAVKYIGRIDGNGEYLAPKYTEATPFTDPLHINKKVKEAIRQLKHTYSNLTVAPKDNFFYLYDTEFPEAPTFIGSIDREGNVTFGKSTVENTKGGIAGSDSQDLIILRCLSMNAKMPLRSIGILADVTSGTVLKRKRDLEKRFGIRYIAEIDLQELGYNKYWCFVKFDEVVPSIETLRKVLSKEPRVQMAAMVKGNYDIAMYFIAKNNDDITNTIYMLRQGPLKDYKSSWYLTPYNNYYGYIPLRDEFFDIIERDKVWIRERDDPVKPKDKITYSEYVTLRELNTNGDSDFTEIAERFKLKPYNVQYAYHALREKYRFLKRVTLTMHNMPAEYNAILIAKTQDMAAFQDTRKNLMLNVIEEKAPINKYTLEGDISSPDSIMFIAPVFSGSGLADLKRNLLDAVKGIEVEDMIVTDIIVGRLCYRLFDNMYSNQYKRLVEIYKLKTYDNMILYDKEISTTTEETTIEVD